MWGLDYTTLRLNKGEFAKIFVRLVNLKDDLNPPHSVIGMSWFCPLKWPTTDGKHRNQIEPDWHLRSSREKKMSHPSGYVSPTDIMLWLILVESSPTEGRVSIIFGAAEGRFEPSSVLWLPFVPKAPLKNLLPPISNVRELDRRARCRRRGENSQKTRQLLSQKTGAAAGIEPTPLRPKRRILPLNYAAGIFEKLETGVFILVSFASWAEHQMRSDSHGLRENATGAWSRIWHTSPDQWQVKNGESFLGISSNPSFSLIIRCGTDWYTTSFACIMITGWCEVKFTNLFLDSQSSWLAAPLHPIPILMICHAFWWCCLWLEGWDTWRSCDFMFQWAPCVYVWPGKKCPKVGDYSWGPTSTFYSELTGVDFLGFFEGERKCKIEFYLEKVCGTESLIGFCGELRRESV